MTIPAKHPADEVLFSYTSGRLETAFSIVIATHISMCSQCAQTVSNYMGAAGEVIEMLPPESVGFSIDDILTSEQETITMPAQVDPTHGDTGDTPWPLFHYIKQPLEKVKWGFLTPYLKRFEFDVQGKAKAGMLRMDPGKSVPPHGHNGQEFTVVLQGGYYDGETAYTKGDIQLVDHKTAHVPTAMADGPCVVLYAKDAPLRFSNWIPRILQPLLKM